MTKRARPGDDRTGLRSAAIKTTILAVAALLHPLAVSADSGARPAAESYILHCSGCHGADGRGVAELAPDLRAIGALLALQGGRSYLASVPGVAQAPLDDAELARLLNWVLGALAASPPDPAYTADEVGRLRAEPLRDPIAARRGLFTPDR